MGAVARALQPAYADGARGEVDIIPSQIAGFAYPQAVAIDRSSALTCCRARIAASALAAVVMRMDMPLAPAFISSRSSLSDHAASFKLNRRVQRLLFNVCLVALRPGDHRCGGPTWRPPPPKMLGFDRALGVRKFCEKISTHTHSLQHERASTKLVGLS